MMMGMLAATAQTGDKYFSNKDYRSAVIAYEKEVGKSPDKYLNLAKSHFALKQFDEAAAAMRGYRDNYGSADKTMAENWIQLLERNDDPVRINNLGSAVNTDVNEYLPVVSADGKTLYFCSDGKAGGLGGEDIWYCEKQGDGSWTAPKNFSSLNTSSHEAMMSISADGNVAILFGNYNGSFGSGDLFYSVKTANGWSVPCNLGGDVNTTGWESQANLSADGKTLIFTSSRDGSRGIGDLWMTRLGENGWSTPVNLGSQINSTADEGSPQLAADGKTLYFKSNGHPGFGGYDMFMSRRLDDTWQNWSTPVNMGKYINTVEDDSYLTIPSSGVKAYLNKSNLLDGYGGTDLYEFILPLDMRPESTINVYGKIRDENNRNVAAIIRYHDWETGKEVAQTQSNPADGIYKTSLPLFKKYRVVIDMKGYLYYNTELDLTDPEAIWGKEYMNTILGMHAMNDLMALQQKMDNLNEELKKLLLANSSQIKETFDEYQKTVAEYQRTLTAFEGRIMDAKYEWMGREDLRSEVERDYYLQSITVGAAFELKNIFFDFGKATLKDESLLELDKLVDIMKRSRIVIELGGHTDSVGSDEANLLLSQERVNSVRAYLVGKGVTQERISAVGYGETQPIADNKTDVGRAANRRVEAKITEILQEGKDVAGAYTEEEKAPDFDILSALQRAARNGGVPDGSYCSDKVVLTTDVDPDEYIVVKKGNDKGFNPGNIKLGNGDYFERDQYIYGSFNISAINMGFKNPNYEWNPLAVDKYTYWGIELNRVKENYKEGRWRLYGLGGPGTSYGLGHSQLWDIRLHKLTTLNLNLMFGFDADVYALSELDNDDYEAKGFLTIPVGLRYVHELGSLKIGPEVFYNYGLLQPSGWPSATHLRVGSSIRWKFLQGGVFLNIGEEINYLGLRAGFAF